MLSHDNLMWSVIALLDSITPDEAPFTEEERIVSYLPLSHIAGLLFDVLSHIHGGNKIYFARPDAL